MIVTSSGATLVLLFSGSAVLCLLGVALTVSMAVGRLAAWDRAPVSGLVAGSTVLTALVLEGYIYPSMSPWSALLLAAAPAGAGSPAWNRFGGSRKYRPRFQARSPSSFRWVAVGWAAASSPFE